MDIPNKYPVNSRGWHHIEGIKWFLKWEEALDAGGEALKDNDDEAFADQALPVAREFLMSHKPGELSEVLVHLDALKTGIEMLTPLIAGYEVVTMLQKLGKGEHLDGKIRGKQLDALINEIFSNCGIPRVGEDFDPT